MTHHPTVGARDVSFLEALRRGIRLAQGAPGVVGLALGAEVGGGLLALASGAALAAVLAPSLERMLAGAGGEAGLAPLVRGTPLAAVAGAAAVAALLCLALRLLFAATGARLFAAKLAGEQLSFSQAFAGSRLDRALPAAVLFAIVSAATALFDAALIGAALLIASRSAGVAAGVPAAAALSASLALALTLRLLLSLLLPLWLIRAVASDEGATSSLLGALKLLGRRLGALVGIAALFGLFGAVLSAIANSGGALALGTAPELLGLALGARAASGLLAAGLKALLSTVELGALAAIDAGARGALPEPPVPLAELVLPTEVILSTREAPRGEESP